MSPSCVKLPDTSHGSLAAFTVQVYKYPPSCLELLSECVFVVSFGVNAKTLSENWKASVQNS